MRRHYHGTYATVTIIFLVLAWFSWKDEKLQEEKSINNISNKTYTVTKKNVNNLSEHANIDQTLRIVAEKWKKTDVNRDGKNNCIDAAVLFYKYYPDKNKVCIELNYNPNTGLNHLFNCVFTNGVWKAIEPQAYYNNHTNYLMGPVWGNEYDKKYNKDVTEEYKKYAR